MALAVSKMFAFSQTLQEHLPNAYKAGIAAMYNFINKATSFSGDLVAKCFQVATSVEAKKAK